MTRCFTGGSCGNRKKLRSATVAAVALVAMLIVSGCGKSETSTAKANEPLPEGATIDAERCAKNRAAGQLTFLTSFGYAAAASIIDVVVADEKGYFKQKCLDVKLQPGFSSDNVSQVSAGNVAFTSLGSATEVVAAIAKESKIKAIAVYGHTSIEELAVKGDEQTDLADIKGTTMGILGSVPYSVRIMLAKAGVSLDSFKQMQVSYDPTLLGKGDFQSRPMYKSNEPRQLDSAGIKYHVFDPAAYKIPASFGVMVANEKITQEHPTAVEDFMSADLDGFKYATEHPEESVGFSLKRSDPKAYLTQDSEQYRWSIESKLVKDSTANGKPIGYLDKAEWTNEIETAVREIGLLPTMPDVSKFYDDRFVK